jgi:RNA polymerase sigma-70 factor, ECF subfamily
MGTVLARERVLTQLRERILAYAASRIGKDLAEDLTQETLLLLEQKYAHVSEPEELLPLCFQILKYKMADFLRKARRRGEMDSVPVDGLPLRAEGGDPLWALEQEELRERLHRALDQLDGRCRDLFRLKLEGKNFAEIQQALGAAAINTVYTWDFRCRKRLLELMGGKVEWLQ